MASTTVERKDSAINDDASTDDQSDFRTDDDGYSSSQQSTADHYHKEGFNPATLRKVDGEWVVSWSFVPKPKAESRVVLYIHGGAGYLLSPRTHRGLIAQISKHAECPVYAVDYRLCPESTFPSAIEDAVAAYCALLGENHRPPGFHGRHHFLGRGFNARIAPPKSAINVFSDFELISPKSSSVNKKKPSYFRASGRPLNLHPSQIVVAGDSSGGCITMQFLVTLKALGLPMPAGGILLSPFVDNELKADSWRRNQHCDYLSVNQLGLRWVVRNIACNPLITDNHPFFSPAHANLSGLCPLLIQVGDAEVLTDDSVKLHENAIAGGVKSQLELYRDMFHVFQAFPMIAAADVAIKRMGLFVKGLPMQVQTATPFSTFDNMRLPQDATFKTTRNLHDANGDPLSRGTRPVSSSSSLMQALGKLRGNDTESMPPSSTLQNTITSYDIETRRWLWGRKMSPSISSSMLKTESGAGSSVTLVPEQSGVDSFRLTKASGPAEAVVITVRNWGRVVEEERVSTVRYIAPVHH
ncbi:alpha/beta hydrolase fold-domain-containing protein [Chytridium lagenaria]|nr:alpha/beta hydrolase fold-domain-containing protein [Chytridium lagenaria]